MNLVNWNFPLINTAAVVCPLKNRTFQIHHAGETLLPENLRRPRGTETHGAIKNRFVSFTLRHRLFDVVGCSQIDCAAEMTYAELLLRAHVHEQHRPVAA